MSLIRHLRPPAFLLFGMNLSFAQHQPQPPPDKTTEKPKDEKKPPVPEEKIVQTKHSLKIGGQEIQYTPTARTIPLKLEHDTPQARTFYLPYTKDYVSPPRPPPPTFR